MKKVIDGKLYNTQTAELIAEHESPRYYRSDFGWYIDRLYKTKRGAWFIEGEGHAASHWSRSCGQNCSGPGSGLKPITNEEARNWLEYHGEIDLLEKYFVIQEA